MNSLSNNIKEFRFYLEIVSAIQYYGRVTRLLFILKLTVTHWWFYFVLYSLFLEIKMSTLDTKQMLLISKTTNKIHVSVRQCVCIYVASICYPLKQQFFCDSNIRVNTTTANSSQETEGSQSSATNIW